jgi:hypothetical protein
VQESSNIWAYLRDFDRFSGHHFVSVFQPTAGQFAYLAVAFPMRSRPLRRPAFARKNEVFFRSNHTNGPTNAPYPVQTCTKSVALRSWLEIQSHRSGISRSRLEILRSRLEIYPHSGGNTSAFRWKDVPQRSGTISAVGWKYSRSRVEIYRL